MNIQTTKPPRRKKNPLTEDQKKKMAQRSFERRMRATIEKVGFARVKSEGKEINFKGRTGEIDDMFIMENVLLICEYYTGKNCTEHFFKKKPLFDLMSSNSADFVDFALKKYTGLQDALGEYGPSDVHVKIVYITKQEPSDEVDGQSNGVRIFSGNIERYFHTLISSIEKSARWEFLKFLGVDHENFGLAALRPSRNYVTFNGLLLPEGNSTYPKGHKVVSFYADPESLLDKSYVLRRDGWRDEDQLYQRIIVKSKIRSMREYLDREGRVFINNIIVTLHPDTVINDLDNAGRNLADVELSRSRAVSIQVPYKFDAVGIVDGQHRVFCYHEGSDKTEDKIKNLRKRQTLLVTGIIYPQSATEWHRREFEAKLFLEINSNQTRIPPALTHDIEVILKPHSGLSLAKRVIREMARRGPYKGLLQAGFFDEPKKIKTASIVAYALKPLVRLEGEDSLIRTWPEREQIHGADGTIDAGKVDEYIQFAVGKINDIFIEAKRALQADMDIHVKDNEKHDLLKPTVIAGFMSCLRQLVGDGAELSRELHQECFKNLNKVDFSRYKSSHWKQLGDEIHKICYTLGGNASGL